MGRRERTRRFGASLLAFAVAQTLAGVTSGQTWNGGGGNSNWTTGANWVGGSPPAASGSSIGFNGTTSLFPIVNAAYSPNTIGFFPGAGSFNLGSSAGSLSIGAGGVQNTSGVLQTINVPLTISTSQTWNTAAAGDATRLTGASALSAGTTLTKTGAGTLRISGPQNNVFNSNLNVSAGNLVLDTDAGFTETLFTLGSGRKLNLSVATGTTTTINAPKQHLRTLTIGSGSNVGVFNNGNRFLGIGTGSLVPNPLTISGTGQLDLVDNKMAVRAGTLGTLGGSGYTGITGLVYQGRTSATGIFSSVGGGLLKELAVMSNLTFFTPSNPAPNPSTFNPQPPIGTPTLIKPPNLQNNARKYNVFPGVAGERLINSDILVRYTFLGDCNLDGWIDGKDYYLMHYGFNHQGSPGVEGMYFGDLDLDGDIDGDDFFYIDSNYSSQGVGSPVTPFLPSSNANGVMTFTNVPSGAWYDPPVTSIVDYATTDGSKITQISGLPPGFAAMEVLVDGESIGTFTEEDTVELADYDPNGEGVLSFSIRGIAPTIDTGNDTIFPIQMSFDQDTVSFTMTTPQGWIVSNGGNWSTAGNWRDGTIPSGVGATASFLQAITDDRTVTLDTARTVGTVSFDNTQSYTISGSNALTMQVSSGSAAINVLRGSHQISAPVVLASNTEVTVTPAGSTLTLSGDMSGAGGLTKSGAGKLKVQHVRAASLDVAAGALEVADSSLAAGVSKVGPLSVSAGATLDLRDNKLITTSAIGSWTGSTYTDITGMIQSGRGDGSWNGSGIRTSMTDATTSVLTTLAVALAEDVGYAGGTFGGHSVSNGDVLVMYTWGGDADLNGELNGDDYFYIDSNILAVQSGATELLSFHNGDFDYNGEINGDDYFILDSNILQAQASGIVWATGAGAAGLTSVPEPGCVLGMAMLAGLGSLSRKRR